MDVFHSTASHTRVISTANLSWLLIALLLVTPFIQLPVLFDAAGMPRYGFIAAVISILGLIWSIFSFRKKQTIYWHKPLIWLLAYTGWAGISYFWSTDPEATIDAMHHLLLYSCLVFIILQIDDTGRLIRLVFATSVIAGTIVAILGHLQILDIEPLGLYQSKPPAATFVNRNHAAQYIDLISPLAFGLMLTATSTKQRWVYGLAFGLILSYQINIFSRGSWLALLTAAICLGIILYKYTDFRTTFFSRLAQCRSQLLMSLLITMLFLFISNSSPSLDIEDKMAMNSSVDIRLKSYANGFGAILDKPVSGVGYGAFMLGFRPYMFSVAPLVESNENKYLVNLHNDFLQAFIETGILGGLLFLTFYLLLLKTAWSNLGHSDTKLQYYDLGLLLAIVAFGAHALVSFPMYRPTSALEFWVLAGLILSRRKYTCDIPSSYTPIIKGFFVISFSLIMLFTLNHYYYQIPQSYYLNKLKSELKSKNCSKALTTANKIEFTASYYSRIILPLTYNLCPTSPPDIALRKLDEILKYDPNNSVARVTRGMIYLDKKQTQNAITDFLNVIKILPQQPTAYIGLGHAALQRGDIQLAKTLYKKTLMLDNSNQTAREMLDKIHEHERAVK